MGHYYQDLDKPHFDYELATYPPLGEKLYRGPAVDLSRPYAVCIGAAQTYGRFTDRPYTKLLAEELQLPVLNLGVGGAGPEHFDSPAYIDVINGSEFAVIQVLSGRSASNSRFNNRLDGGVLGKRLVDNKTMRFEHFFEELFASEDKATIEKVIRETREDYKTTFINLVNKINVPKIMFWFSDRTPDYEDNLDDPYAVLNRYPQMINRPVIDSIRGHCDDYVEYAHDVGVPQKLWSGDADIDGARHKDGCLYNTYYPSPEMHLESAAQLLSVCRKYAVPSSKPTAVAANPDEPAKFVLLCPERSGSNLLMGLMDSHHECLAAGEMFNDYYLNLSELPTSSDELARDQRLAQLRSDNPAAFVHAFFDVARDRKLKAIGFKLIYGQAELHSSVREEILRDQSIYIIHLVRRNLLDRFASEVRARNTDKWAYGADETIPERQKYTIPPDQCIWDFLDKQNTENKYFNLLEGRDRVLKIYYENLSQNPQGVSNRVCRLLGLSVRDDLEIRFKKSSSKKLQDDVENYAELKALFSRWSHFFDD